MAALDLAGRALALDPFNTQALYLEAVLLKEARRDDELAERLDPLLAFHPNQASIRRLAGEAAFRSGAAARAADLLSEALWINPTPPASPAAFWRMAMTASDAAGRPEEALGAAVRALTLVDGDHFLSAAERRDLKLDAAGVFTRNGWTLAGAHLREVVESGADD